MTENTYPKLAQGPAKPATPEDLRRDEVGITNPNLHRRIDNSLGDIPLTFSTYLVTAEDGYVLISEDGFALLGDNSASDRAVYPKADYIVSVSGVNSYRATRREPHDETSTDSEVP